MAIEDLIDELFILFTVVTFLLFSHFYLALFSYWFYYHLVFYHIFASEIGHLDQLNSFELKFQRLKADLHLVYRWIDVFRRVYDQFELRSDAKHNIFFLLNQLCQSFFFLPIFKFLWFENSNRGIDPSLPIQIQIFNWHHLEQFLLPFCCSLNKTWFPIFISSCKIDFL